MSALMVLLPPGPAHLAPSQFLSGGTGLHQGDGICLSSFCSGSAADVDCTPQPKTILQGLQPPAKLRLNDAELHVSCPQLVIVFLPRTPSTPDTDLDLYPRNSKPIFATLSHSLSFTPLTQVPVSLHLCSPLRIPPVKSPPPFRLLQTLLAHASLNFCRICICNKLLAI